MGDNNQEVGLTSEDITNVQKSWGLLKPEWKKVGPAYFIRLFKEFPGIKAFFKMFDNLSWEEIERSKKLYAHTINFKLGVSSYIDHLDDLDTVAILIGKTAENHFRRNIQPIHFKQALQCFYDLIKDDNRADEKTLKSWSKVLAVVGDVMEQSLNRLEATEKNGE